MVPLLRGLTFPSREFPAFQSFVRLLNQLLLGEAEASH